MAASSTVLIWELKLPRILPISITPSTVRYVCRYSILIRLLMGSSPWWNSRRHQDHQQNVIDVPRVQQGAIVEEGEQLDLGRWPRIGDPLDGILDKHLLDLIEKTHHEIAFGLEVKINRAFCHAARLGHLFDRRGLIALIDEELESGAEDTAGRLVALATLFCLQGQTILPWPAETRSLLGIRIGDGVVRRGLLELKS